MPFFLFLLLLMAAAPTRAAEPDDIWSRYHEALDRAYAEAATRGAWPVVRDFEELLELVENSPPRQSATIGMSNKAFILSNVENPEIQTLVARLLQVDLYRLAEQIRAAADETGDRYLRTKLNYEFARYHLNRGEWAQCQHQLDRGVFANALSPTEKDSVSIMRGILLQRRAQHRAAVPFYTQVPSTSAHYGTAQLNLATVYIRQDWWTDAHQALHRAIKITSNKTFQDRLYTVLGFSQLQKEFYRDSRESFRQVRTESPYSVRALFGLGMAALHQGDYPGALNAFRLLKQMGTFDKSVVESYLMLPITLEKMGQMGTASAGFNEAIAYYESYALELEQSLLKLRRSPDEKALQSANSLSLLATRNASVEAAIATLAQMQELTISDATQRELSELLGDYQSLRGHFAARKLEKSHDIVQHYLNQARFALARLHDARNKEEQ